MQIDHDPREFKKPGGRIWWLVATVLAALWSVSLWLIPLHLHSLALGGFTGLMLAAWACDVTDNKVPPSWRGRSGDGG
jgi:peptidoglycan/LPS O-acetylase OafA/YrhL